MPYRPDETYESIDKIDMWTTENHARMSETMYELLKAMSKVSTKQIMSKLSNTILKLLKPTMKPQKTMPGISGQKQM